jgi:hypothetical protein
MQAKKTGRKNGGDLSLRLFFLCRVDDVYDLDAGKSLVADPVYSREITCLHDQRKQDDVFSLPDRQSQQKAKGKYYQAALSLASATHQCLVHGSVSYNKRE